MCSWSRLPGGARAPVLALVLAVGGVCPGAGATANSTATATPTETSTATPTETSTATPTETSTPTADASSTPDELAEQIVIIGRRLRGQVPGDPTAAATVVSAERFAGEAKGVAELVATAPGVAVSEYGGLGHAATVSIRGSTADGVLVLLDGLPLNTAFGGGVDLASIPRHWIDRIEIVRGVEGAHYGAGALGGVVNVVTRRARGTGWSGEASAGSWETFSASADRSLSLGAASLLAAAGAESSGGAFTYDRVLNPDDPSGRIVVEERRTNDAARRAGGMVKLALPLGAARLDALAQVSGGRRELPGSPRRPTPDDRQEDARAALSARLARTALGDRLVLAGRLGGRFDWLGARTAGFRTGHRGLAGALEGEARLRHRGGGLRASVEVEEEALQAAALGGTRHRLTIAASISDDLLVADRLRVGPALRAERAGAFEGLSAKLGASLRIAGPLALRASAGSTFRAPSFAELSLQQALVAPNPDLVPEEGLGGDAALVLDAGPVFASLGAHATLFRDLVYYQQASLGRFKPFNAGKVLVRGLEVEVATAPAPALLGLSVAASYTLLATEILRGVPGTLGNEVPHRARHRLYARAAVEPGPAGAHLEAHLVGRQFDDAQNQDPIPATLAWNAGASLRLARRPALLLALEVRNALDDRSLQDAFGYPLPGRTWLVSVRAGSPTTEGRP